MGDRANVLILDEFDADQGVYIYSHWNAATLFGAAVAALSSDAARDRWDDGQYLTRIVTQQTLNAIADEHASMGAGLSVRIGDNEYPVLVLDSATQRAAFRLEGSERGRIEDTEGVPFAKAATLLHLRYPSLQH